MASRMYLGSDARSLDETEAFNFVEQHGFAVLFGPERYATQIPLVLDRERRTLLGHIARANPHAGHLGGAEILAMFTGPHAYISPTWLGRTPAVPTWNYATVQVQGTVTILGPEDTLAAVHAVVRQYEPTLLEQRDILTDAYTDRLLGAVTGFSVSIERIEGKFKLGQEKPAHEQRAVVAGLAASTDPDAGRLLEFMRAQGIGLGDD